jgi:uncharacterized low-complexity protein
MRSLGPQLTKGNTMKIVATLALFVSAMAFANPTATTGTATTAAPTTATAPADTKGTMDHGKMGHGKAKAAAATATATECKNKAADGKCLDEVKK